MLFGYGDSRILNVVAIVKCAVTLASRLAVPSHVKDIVKLFF